MMDALMRAAPAPQAPFSQGYVLIETATIGYAAGLETLPSVACAPAALSHRIELMPRLVNVSALSPEQQTEIAEVMRDELDGDRPPVICAWLQSCWPVDQLAEHVARYLVGPGANGTPVLWRYYDPRVISLATSVLEPAKLSALLGPVDTWTLPAVGRWWTISGDGREAPLLEGITPAWPTPAQWERIEYSDLAARAFARLSDQKYDFRDLSRLMGALCKSFDDAKQKAGISDPDALIDYAVHDMRYGRSFTEHKKLEQAWPAIRRGELTWPGALALLTSADFELLKDQHAVIA
jgi:hypothetical protein